MSTTVTLICGDAPRHAWLARQLAASSEIQLNGVVIETKVDPVATARVGEARERAVLEDHFRERARAELERMGAVAWPDVATLSVGAGGRNAAPVLGFLDRQRSSLVALFGCGLVGGEILDAYRDRVVNLHLGLSPWYRGTGTNFWPLVDDRPECVGATVHLASARVDHGAMLAQVRPALTADDDCHAVGFKALEAVAEVAPGLLARFARGDLTLHQPAEPTGPTFRRADLTAQAVLKMRDNFAMGMMPRFIERKNERLAKYPVVEASHA